MKEYHKIQSIFLRDPKTKHKNFLMGQYSRPEFEYLANNEWSYEEKIDGTNIRIHWEDNKVTIGGRTKDAQTPTFLINKLTELFSIEKMKSIFSEGGITLYGEGYGAKIQKGGGDYIPNDCNFILFDVLIDGWWLKRESVKDISVKLGIECAPIIGHGTLLTALKLCQDGFESKLRKTPPEGLVLRPNVELFARNGERIITKIKLKDFS